MEIYLSAIYELLVGKKSRKILLLNNIGVVFNIFGDNYCCELRETCFVIITFLPWKLRTCRIKCYQKRYLNFSLMISLPDEVNPNVAFKFRTQVTGRNTEVAHLQQLKRIYFWLSRSPFSAQPFSGQQQQSS